MKRYDKITFIDYEITGVETTYLDANGDDTTAQDAVYRLTREHATFRAIMDGSPVEIRCFLDDVQPIACVEREIPPVLSGPNSQSIIRNGVEHVFDYENDDSFVDNLDGDIEIYLIHKND